VGEGLSNRGLGGLLGEQHVNVTYILNMQHGGVSVIHLLAAT
jgi:hypothetical protein